MLENPPCDCMVAVDLSSPKSKCILWVSVVECLGFEVKAEIVWQDYFRA